MPTYVKPFTFTNGTTIDATEFNLNFDTLYAGVNGNLDTANISSKVKSGLEMANISIVRATTTNAGDSIKITSADGTALSSTNSGQITMTSATTAGQLTILTLTADVTILLTGAHFGIGTTGDIAGALLRVLAVNDNGTLKFGVAYLSGRHTLLTTDTSATSTSVTEPEHVLCNSAVGSSSNTCREIGYVRADFDDTGGAAEDLWAIQSGINDVVTGRTADGIWQPAIDNTQTGFSVSPSGGTAKWTQTGRLIRFSRRSNTNGTSNGTGYTYKLPVKSKTIQDGTGAGGVDNGAALTTTPMVQTSTDSRTLNIYPHSGGGNWTAANAKDTSFEISFEVGPSASFIN